MIVPIASQRAGRALEFGLYRDGDNNLDLVQGKTIAQAADTSRADRTVEFTVEDTTARDQFGARTKLHTEDYKIDGGGIVDRSVSRRPHDMAARSNLAAFVARTLENAHTAHAAQTWVDLVDHGAGDGGGLEADHGSDIMRSDDIAGAIADGVALHAKEHPEDAQRKVDGLVANQCLMATLGFSSALSHAGVRFLAASPETMLAPGVPSSVAHAIAQHVDDPLAMARAVVDETMDKRYHVAGAGAFGPAAAFDVLDLDPKKIGAVEDAVKQLDDALTAAAKNRAARSAIREDARAIGGMVRFPHDDRMPWQADRPALALYGTFLEDGRLPDAVRIAAQAATNAVSATVLAHRESDDFAPFAHADYSDAAGPTVHFPTRRNEIDPWAPRVSETGTAFYKSVDGSRVAGAVA
jgi:hypothetical protein